MNDINPHTENHESEEHVRLIAQAQRRIYAFILALVRRPADAEDILQETNVILWRKREQYESGTDFFAWAFAIARFQVLAHRSRQTRHVLPFDDKLLEDIAKAASAESGHYDRRDIALRGCLEKLSPSQRELISRRYQPEVAVNSLALELGKTAKAVSESLRRIREKLRQCVEQTLAAEAVK